MFEEWAPGVHNKKDPNIEDSSDGLWNLGFDLQIYFLKDLSK